MGTKMQYRIGIKVFANVAIEGREGMGWCKAFFIQEAHGIALVAKARLNRYKHITKLLTEHK